MQITLFNYVITVKKVGHSKGRWSKLDKAYLKEMHWNKETISDMAKEFNRSEKAIVKKLHDLSIYQLPQEDIS